MKVMISIVIPVYRTEQFLPKCLDSCINQSYQNIEIIIVNDASPDNSESIISTYQQNDKRIRYIKNEKNLGLFLAREAGVSAASAAYILHLDSDDWLDKDLCKHLVESLKENPDLVFFNMLSVRTKGIEKGLWTNKGFQNFEGGTCFKALCSRELSSWTVAGKLFSRELSLEVYRQINLSQHLNMAEDILFCSYYTFKTQKAIFVPFGGYYYNLTNQSVNRTKYTIDKAKAHISNLETVTQKLNELIETNNLDNSTFNEIKRELAQGYLLQIKELSIQDLQQIQVKLSEIFALQLVELSVQQSVMQHNIFRCRFDKAIAKLFKPNQWLYENLRFYLLKIIKK